MCQNRNTQPENNMQCNVYIINPSFDQCVNPLEVFPSGISCFPLPLNHYFQPSFRLSIAPLSPILSLAGPSAGCVGISSHFLQNSSALFSTRLYFRKIEVRKPSPLNNHYTHTSTPHSQYP